MAEAGFIHEAQAGADMIGEILEFFADRDNYADDKMMAEHDAAMLPGHVSNVNEEDLYSLKVCICVCMCVCIVYVCVCMCVCADDKMMAVHDAAMLPGHVSNVNEEDLYSLKVCICVCMCVCIVYVCVCMCVCADDKMMMSMMRLCCLDMCPM